jgi:hypothetical protein
MGAVPCLCLPLSVCLCLSASVHTIRSKRIDSIGLDGNSHWTALSAPHHRPINRPTEIRVSRKYASRPKVSRSTESPYAYSITQCEFSHKSTRTCHTNTMKRQVREMSPTHDPESSNAPPPHYKSFIAIVPSSLPHMPRSASQHTVTQLA